MRVLRLRLRNWRGVEDREVRFAPTGVTVVEGPNEAGKSSLIEALDLLFDELDSSSKARVRAVKPVHADVGASVEADVETGPYEFTYSKQYHRKTATTLTVRTPAPESRTGREAHERADELLRETLDVPLWKALRVAQGGGLAQAEISATGWLSQALERAAGGTSRGGEREDTLFEAIRDARDRWWTDAGKPKKELADAERRLTEATAEFERLRAEVARVEQDVERAAALAREVARSETVLADLARRADERARAAAAVATLRSARDDAEKRLAQAGEARTRAQAARDERRRVAADADAARATDALAAEAPGLASARLVLDESVQALADAETQAAAATRAAEQAERDFEYRRDELDLAQLDERRIRLECADRAAAEAEIAVAGIRVDDATLAKLRKLRDDVVRAEVRLDAASAAVRIEALAACSPEIEGAATPLAVGDVREVRVSGKVRVELPGALRIDVRSGAGTDEPRADHDRCRRALETALGAAGVASLDDAVSANTALRDAKRALADRERVVKEALRDLARDTLARKIENLRARVAAFLARRGARPPLPADYDAAQDLRRRTKDASAAATSIAASARDARDVARRLADEAAARCRDGEVRLRLLRERAQDLRTALARAHAEAPDADLERALGDAALGWAARSAEAKSAGDALAAAQPEIVEELARTARDAAERARTEHRQRERELDALRAGLAARGDEGYAARLGAAEADLDIAQQEHARKRAQAGAARALFDAMTEARNQERARYVLPFRAKVEALGKIVFGPEFSVTVSDDLRIVSRTLTGRTVEFESLSGGTREQIGVISRLACALLAAEQGGVPVVLDDSFGWSDPDRLERMGALLAFAGRTCQVILLTCDPARARSIPGADVIHVG